MIKTPAPIITKLNKIVITLLLSLDSKNVPIRPPANVPIATCQSILTSVCPPIKYAMLDIMLTGKITSTAVECATFGHCLKINLKRGTTSIPPPDPKKPFTNPTKSPAKIAQTTCHAVNFFSIVLLFAFCIKVMSYLLKFTKNII